MIRRYTVLLAAMVLVLFACQKENNAGFPTVQITAPTGKPTYTAMDTIVVKATVSDANNLQSVGIYIENSKGVVVTSVANVTITGKNMSFAFYYPINNIHLTTGQYTLVVKASNGTNTTNAYQAINITATPTMRLGVYAITRSGNTVTASKLDSNYNASAIYSQTGDYSSSDINSYYQQLYIAAADSGNADAIIMPPGGALWSAQGIVGPQPCFTNVYSYGDGVYISDYLGYLKYYNANGLLSASIKVPSGYYPIKTLVWGGYLFAEEKNIGAMASNLVLYNTTNFIGFEQNTLPGPVVAMYNMDALHIFVFGNNYSGGAYLQQYSISGNIFYSPTTLPNAKLLSVAQVDSVNYLMGFSDGNIYQYTYSPNGVVTYISGVTASNLRYDNVEQRIIAASGSHVYEYGYYSKTLLHTATLPDSVLNVHILYNK